LCETIRSEHCGSRRCSQRAVAGDSKNPAGRVQNRSCWDQSVFIKASIESIQTHLIEGSILAAIVVFIFLWSFRSTVIAALAIPTSLIATFGLMAAMGFTLNQITMLALTLMVGIVIDDAIVVLENIFRFIEEKGCRRSKPLSKGRARLGSP